MAIGKDLIQLIAESKKDFLKRNISDVEKKRTNEFFGQVVSKIKNIEDQQINSVLKDPIVAKNIIEDFYYRIKQTYNSKKYSFLVNFFMNIASGNVRILENEIHYNLKLFDKYTYVQFCLIKLFKSNFGKMLKDGNGIYSAVQYQRRGDFVLDTEVVSIYEELTELGRDGMILGYNGNVIDNSLIINPSVLNLSTLGENFFLFFELKNIDDNDVRDLPKLLNKYLN